MTSRGASSDDRARPTLGALLPADKTTVGASEKDFVAWVQRIAARDASALQALYQRAHRMVFTLSLRITANREAAEEVTVDVFHDVWRRAAGYDPAGGSVLGWIMNQARSRAIDRLRFEGRKKRVVPQAGASLSGSAVSDPRESLDQGEQSRRLQAALAVLTPDERLAIETAFWSELSHSEVAERLRQPLGTIKTRIRSGLGKLREVLTTGRE